MKTPTTYHVTQRRDGCWEVRYPVSGNVRSTYREQALADREAGKLNR